MKTDVIDEAVDAPEAALQLSQSLPLGEAVYQSLRTAIESGAFAPGSRLREALLADRLGVSRTPIREALRRLLADGLVTQTPSRRLIVTNLSRIQVLELFALREILEGSAAAFAAHRATNAEIELLTSIIQREVPFVEAGDGQMLLQLNNDFHRAIWEAGRNRYLEAALRSTADALSLLQGATLDDPGRQRRSHEQHAQILAAIEQRDAELAEKVAREHIRDARRVRMGMLFPN